MLPCQGHLDLFVAIAGCTVAAGAALAVVLRVIVAKATEGWLSQGPAASASGTALAAGAASTVGASASRHGGKLEGGVRPESKETRGQRKSRSTKSISKQNRLRK